MKRYWNLMWMLLVIFVLSSCAPKVNPIVQNAYETPCFGNNPVFEMQVLRNNALGPFTSVVGTLIINGKHIRMNSPSGSLWGIYKYSGDIPHDGEARFRYLFSYTQGTGVTPSPTSVKRFYRPSDGYYLRPVGKITWSGSNVIELPNDFTFGAPSIAPHKMLNVQELILRTTTGPVSASETLTLINNEFQTITVEAPQVVDLETDSQITDFVVTPASGSITYPIYILRGQSVDFTVQFNATVSGTTISKKAGIKFPWSFGMETCIFGPVWVYGSFWTNQ